MTFCSGRSFHPCSAKTDDCIAALGSDSSVPVLWGCWGEDNERRKSEFSRIS